MVSNSNTIAYLSGKLLDLFSKLPHYLIIGMDKEGTTVFSNKQHVGLSKEAANLISQSIEQFVSSESSWRNELDKSHYLNQPKLSLEAFRLPTDENKPIQYVFLVEVKKPNVKDKPINVSKESEPVVALLNEVIGLSNNLIKAEEHGTTRQFAQYIYDKAWEIKEAMQGSIISKIESLPEGYDLIDFNELFEKALNMKQFDFDSNDIIIDAQTNSFIFFSHFKCLQLLVTGLTKWCYNHSTKQPISFAFRVSKSDTGATIRLESEPVDMPERILKNDQIQELVSTLKGTLKIISIAEEKDVLEINIPSA